MRLALAGFRGRAPCDPEKLGGIRLRGARRVLAARLVLHRRPPGTTRFLSSPYLVGPLHGMPILRARRAALLLAEPRRDSGLESPMLLAGPAETQCSRLARSQLRTGARAHRGQKNPPQRLDAQRDHHATVIRCSSGSVGIGDEPDRPRNRDRGAYAKDAAGPASTAPSSSSSASLSPKRFKRRCRRRSVFGSRREARDARWRPRCTAAPASRLRRSGRSSPQNRHRYGKAALDGAPVHGLLAWLWHRPT